MGTALRGCVLPSRRHWCSDGMEPYVATLFAQALARLSAAGAHIEPIDLPEFAEIAAINGKGGFGAAEAYAWHRRLLGEKAALYDPRILARILRGREQDAADYIELTEKRAAFIAGVEKRMAGYDLLAMPTVPIVAPAIAEVDADDATLLARQPADARAIPRRSISWTAVRSRCRCIRRANSRGGDARCAGWRG